MSLNPEARMSLKDFLNKEIEQRESWWGNQLFGPGYRLIVSGKGGTRKSFFTLGMILTMAMDAKEDHEYLAFPMIGGLKILYMNFEINECDVQDRLKHMTREVPENALRRIDIMNSYDFRIDRPGDATTFINMVLAGKYNIVALDCMYKMHNSKENDEQEMKKILMLLDVLIERGIGIVLVHHHSKHFATARGSSVITDWADTVIGLEKKDNKIYFNKVRHAEEPEPVKTQFNEHLFFVANEGIRADVKICDEVIMNIMQGLKVKSITRSEVGSHLERLGIAQTSSLRKYKPSNVLLKEVRKGNRTYYVVNKQVTKTSVKASVA